ncbi:hypothetical protein CHS0354_028717 [Potamilus streckersoni]|uniref:Uncharacterized protein n=1 Tax=Potamilus streckersoni TaxID=2493646 RepID=A0AAE0SYH5_9BIVA|nr:hypothetical protein CHS0354_028717 [Potamilus streckersoni]
MRINNIKLALAYEHPRSNGGTVGIAVHEVIHGGHLRELYEKNGEPRGGTTVDDAFGSEFEVKKRTVSPELDQNVTFKIPITLHEAFQDDHGRSF